MTSNSKCNYAISLLRISSELVQRHPTPSSVDYKNEQSSTATLPVRLYGVHSDSFVFYLIRIRFRRI